MLKRYKAPGSDQIPAEMIQAGRNTAYWDTYNYYVDLRQRKIDSQVEGIICRTYSQRGDKTDCSNYRGMLLLSPSYNILSNIFLSRPIPYADEIIGDHQCDFRCNRSTTDIGEKMRV
jgi:hypothetical protein